MLSFIVDQIPWYVFIIAYLLFIAVRIVPLMLKFKCYNRNISLNNFNQTKGVIVSYEVETIQKKVKNNDTGLIEVVDFNNYFPIIKYEVDGIEYTFKYATVYNQYFNNQRVGDEVVIYVDKSNPYKAKALYVDVYAKELYFAKRNNKILAIFFGIVCLAGMIASIIL